MKRSGVSRGTRNVFAGLGRPNAREHLVKAKIVAEISRIIKDRKLTQTDAGSIMGLSQPEVSRLLRGHFREYSVHRVMQLLTKLDRDVEIVIRRRNRRGKGKITVTAFDENTAA